MQFTPLRASHVFSSFTTLGTQLDGLAKSIATHDDVVAALPTITQINSTAADGIADLIKGQALAKNPWTVGNMGTAQTSAIEGVNELGPTVQVIARGNFEVADIATRLNIAAEKFASAGSDANLE